MAGENNGKPYFLMDDLGGKPTILGNPHLTYILTNQCLFRIPSWSIFDPSTAWLPWLFGGKIHVFTRPSIQTYPGHLSTSSTAKTTALPKNLAKLSASAKDMSEKTRGQNNKHIWMFPKIVGFTPKSSISIGVSIINHPFWGIHYFWKHLSDRKDFLLEMPHQSQGSLEMIPFFP